MSNLNALSDVEWHEAIALALAQSIEDVYSDPDFATKFPEISKTLKPVKSSKGWKLVKKDD